MRQDAECDGVGRNSRPRNVSSGCGYTAGFVEITDRFRGKIVVDGLLFAFTYFIGKRRLHYPRIVTSG